MLLLIPASYPKAKAECVKPGGDYTEINETTKECKKASYMVHILFKWKSF